MSIFFAKNGDKGSSLNPPFLHLFFLLSLFIIWPKEEKSLNIILLIGRLVSDVEIRETANGKVATITLAVNRDFKNSDGVYETDFIPVTLWEGFADYAKSIAKKGTLVSLKGRIAVYKRQRDDQMTYVTEIVGEKMMVIAQPQKKED